MWLLRSTIKNKRFTFKKITNLAMNWRQNMRFSLFSKQKFPSLMATDFYSVADFSAFDHSPKIWLSLRPSLGPLPSTQPRVKIRQPFSISNSVAEFKIPLLICLFLSLIPLLFGLFLSEKTTYTCGNNWLPYLLSLCNPMDDDPLT